MASLDTDFTVHVTVTSNLITMQGKYQTRKGEPVRIVCVDGPVENRPIVGFVAGHDYVCQWTLDGLYNDYGTSPTDLIPVPTKHEAYCLVNLSHGEFITAGGCTWPSAKMAASQLPGDGYVDKIVVAHVTWED